MTNCIPVPAKGEILERPWSELNTGDSERPCAVVNGHLVLVSFDVGCWHTTAPYTAIDFDSQHATKEDAMATAEMAARATEPAARLGEWKPMGKREDPWAGAVCVRSESGQHIAIMTGADGPLPWDVSINGVQGYASFADTPGDDPMADAKEWTIKLARRAAAQLSE